MSLRRDDALVQCAPPTPRAAKGWRDSVARTGEQRLAAMLDRQLDGRAIVLHDRSVPGTRGNIDHIAIAGSGVWIIDAKNDPGKVELSDVGGWEKADLRLHVSNREQTTSVRRLGRQVDAVRAHLEPLGLSAAPIRPVICFTHAQWSLFAKPFAIDGVWVTWGQALTQKIDDSGPLTRDEMNAIAHELRRVAGPPASVVCPLPGVRPPAA